MTVSLATSPRSNRTRMTAEEFLRLPASPDGSKLELVRGEVVAVSPPPGPFHGGCCSAVAFLIMQHARSKNLGTVATNDSGFFTHRDPDTVRGPDVAYWSKDRLAVLPMTYTDVPPDLIVEVLSPSDAGGIHEKIREYLEAGVKRIWVVSPEWRTVTVYRQANEGRVLHESAELTGEDVLPGFTCKVAEMFPG